jgi:hypothetical protein
VPLLLGRTGFPSNRGVLIEYGSKGGSGLRKDEGGSCRYDAVRTADTLYVEHTIVVDPIVHECAPTKEVEHYDLSVDPLELENLFPPATAATEREQTELSARLDVLRRCNGTAGGGSPGAPSCE